MPGPAVILGGAMIAKGLFGGFSGRSASKKSAKEAKRVAADRAKELGIQADYEGELAIEQELAQRDVNARRLSQIEGMYAKSGILLTGSPAQAIEKQKETFEYNIQQASGAADERVRRLRVAAQMEKEGGRALASAYDTQGRTAMLSGLFQAGQGVMSLYGPLKNWMGGAGKKPGGIPSRSDSMYNLAAFGMD